MKANGLPSPTPRPQLSLFSDHLCARDSLRHTGPHEQTPPCLVRSVPVTEPPMPGALRKHWLAGGEKSCVNGEPPGTRS